MKKIHLYLVIGLSFILTACNPSGEEGLQKILSSSQAPTGVVFEVASGDEDGMKWVIPMVKSYSRQLREKFPGIKLALVSHGEEQFQFTRSNIQRFANVHKQVKRLVNDEGVQFHVCGNYAASSGVNAEDFVDFIDVAERAPVQVARYEKQGYVVLFLRKPKDK